MDEEQLAETGIARDYWDALPDETREVLSNPEMGKHFHNQKKEIEALKIMARANRQDKLPKPMETILGGYAVMGKQEVTIEKISFTFLSRKDWKIFPYYEYLYQDEYGYVHSIFIHKEE